MENLEIFLKVNETLKKQKTFKSYLSKISKWREEKNESIFIIQNPISDSKKYHYEYSEAIILLIKDYKIMIFNLGEKNEEENFQNFVEDFISDIDSMSKNFDYIKQLGRPRKWKDNLIKICDYKEIDDLSTLINSCKLSNQLSRNSNLIISLLTGSINDIDKIEGNPETLLEHVKKRIVLFDTNQTRFIYGEEDKEKKIFIQGLSGSGKTELLLHKLKNIYIEEPDSKICFTCFNKVLAETLKNRIPNFFDFMKVTEQIKWGERLLVAQSWGSQKNPYSGLYSYICNVYGIRFYSFSDQRQMEKSIWRNAIEELNKIENFSPIFDYIFIDESQDFTKDFLDLCDKVTRKKVYVAGDIFQNIFSINDTGFTNKPNYLLNKVYRTDPRTLLFSHILGFGILEKTAVRWLNNDEWDSCGYKIEHLNGNKYKINRHPLIRFDEETEKKYDYSSVNIIKYCENFFNEAMKVIKLIKKQNPDVEAGDIAIVFAKQDKDVITYSEIMRQKIQEAFGWESIIGFYEERKNLNNEVFISNLNNVKGLEFPFVICINNQSLEEINTKNASKEILKRNALYMILTRSFISSYLIIEDKSIYINILENLSENVKKRASCIVQKPKNIVNNEILEQLSKVEKQTLEEIIQECLRNEKIPIEKYREFIENIASLPIVKKQTSKLDKNLIYGLINSLKNEIIN